MFVEWINDRMLLPSNIKLDFTACEESIGLYEMKRREAKSDSLGVVWGGLVEVLWLKGNKI